HVATVGIGSERAGGLRSQGLHPNEAPPWPGKFGFYAPKGSVPKLERSWLSARGSGHQSGGLPRKAPNMAEMISSARKTKNRILAMPAAVPAMPVNPSRPAM